MSMRKGYEPGVLTARVLAEVRLELTFRDWSISELARRWGMSQTHTSAIMRGVASLTVDTLAEWCDILGVRMLDLVAAAEAGRAQRLPAAGLAQRGEPTQEELDAIVRKVVTESPDQGETGTTNGPTLN